MPCSTCGVRIEVLGFAAPYSRYTRRFDDLVARLCEPLPVANVAELLGMDWKTVKAIDKRALQRAFADPHYSDLRLLSIDEISYKKHHPGAGSGAHPGGLVTDRVEAALLLADWTQAAEESGIEPLAVFAKTLNHFAFGRLNHCDHPINNARLDGLNNKFKVIKRRCYGFHVLH